MEGEPGKPNSPESEGSPGRAKVKTGCATVKRGILGVGGCSSSKMRENTRLVVECDRGKWSRVCGDEGAEQLRHKT